MLWQHFYFFGHFQIAVERQTLRPRRSSGPGTCRRPFADSQLSPRARLSCTSLLCCRHSVRSLRPCFTSGPSTFFLPAQSSPQIRMPMGCMQGCIPGCEYLPQHRSTEVSVLEPGMACSRAGMQCIVLSREAENEADHLH